MYEKKFLHILLPLVVIATSVATKADTLPKDYFGEALSAIEKQEQGVNSISIGSGLSKDTRWDPDIDEWVPNGDLDVMGIYEGVPGGKRRIECHEALTPCDGGTAPFCLEVYKSVYNGRVGTTLTTKSGDPDQPNFENEVEADIVGVQPRQITMALFSTGWGYSIFGTRESSKTVERFSAFLISSRNQPDFEAKLVERNGEKLIRIVTSHVSGAGALKFRNIFWLDPQHGYAIKRYGAYYVDAKDPAGQDADNSARMADCWEVTDFYNLPGGIYYPKHIERSGFFINVNAAPIPTTKSTVDVSQISLNDASIDEHTFEITLPKGAILTDKTDGTRTPILGTPEQQAEIIKAQVKNAREMINSDGTAPK